MFPEESLCKMTTTATINGQASYKYENCLYQSWNYPCSSSLSAGEESGECCTVTAAEGAIHGRAGDRAGGSEGAEPRSAHAYPATLPDWSRYCRRGWAASALATNRRYKFCRAHLIKNFSTLPCEHEGVLPHWEGNEVFANRRLWSRCDECTRCIALMCVAQCNHQFKRGLYDAMQSNAGGLCSREHMSAWMSINRTPSIPWKCLLAHKQLSCYWAVRAKLSAIVLLALPKFLKTISADFVILLCMNAHMSCSCAFASGSIQIISC